MSDFAPERDYIVSTDGVEDAQGHMSAEELEQYLEDLEGEGEDGE